MALLLDHGYEVDFRPDPGLSERWAYGGIHIRVRKYQPYVAGREMVWVNRIISIDELALGDADGYLSHMLQNLDQELTAYLRVGA